MKIGDRIFEQMKIFMDYSTRKQKLITSNLANIDTPGYKAKGISFDDFLSSETGDIGKLTTTDPGHLKGIPQLRRLEVQDRASKDSLGPDGNNVDLEKEMTQMAQNVLKFTVVSRLFRQKLMMVRSGIKEGKG